MTKRPTNFKTPRFGKAFTRPEQDRPSAALRGYGRRWRSIREAYLRDHPHCAACGAVATEVDHVLALRKGGSNERRNLRALCKPCHARKTVAVDGALSQSKNRSQLGNVDPHPKGARVSTKSGFSEEDQ